MSSGQCARLLLRQSKFESCWSTHFFVKFVFEKTKISKKRHGVGPSKEVEIDLNLKSEILYNLQNSPKPVLQTAMIDQTCRKCLKFFVFKNGPIPTSFCSFSSFSHYNYINTTWKKRRCCAWDSNPQPQDGWCRWYHGAMAAALKMAKVTWVAQV